MEANELRIGNNVLRKGIIVQVDHQSFWDMKNKPDEYKPIELTEDWLLKLGLEEVYSGRYLNAGDFYKNFEIMIEGEVMLNVSLNLNTQNVTFEYDTGFGWKELTIQYVHQLQNLYYSITGKELKV